MRCEEEEEEPAADLICRRPDEINAQNAVFVRQPAEQSFVRVGSDDDLHATHSE